MESPETLQAKLKKATQALSEPLERRGDFST
jgi:hypothetical protein